MLIFIHIVLLAGLIPAIIVFSHRGGIEKVGAILPFLLLVAISSIYEFVFTLLLRIDVRIWFTVYNLFSFVAIFYFFHKIYYPKYKLIFIFFLLLFLASLPITFFIDIGLYQFLIKQSISSGLITLFTVIMSILWFMNIFRKMEIPNLWKSPVFYYVSGLLIYHSSTFFLDLLSNTLFKNDKENFIDYWAINIIANLVLRLLLSIGVWKQFSK